jgi:hypothetical protein
VAETPISPAFLLIPSANTEEQPALSVRLEKEFITK